MIVHDKPQVSAGHTEDRIPVVGEPVVGIPVVGEPDVGEPVAVLKTEPKTVNEDDEKNMAAQPEAAPVAGGPAMASRRAHASGASARILTDQDKIDGTRLAIADVYGESWNKTISDDDALALFTLKAPASKPVTSVVRYMTKIFEDTPGFDTLLSKLDDDGSDDYDQARDQQPYPPCPRCGGMKAEIDPRRGVCAWCARELIINACPNPVPAEGWNQAVLNSIKKALFVVAGKSVDDAWAARVAGHIMSHTSGRVHNPARYCASVIESDAHPERFLPTPIPGRAA
jgi:hypothetical protein